MKAHEQDAAAKLEDILQRIEGNRIAPQTVWLHRKLLVATIRKLQEQKEPFE